MATSDRAIGDALRAIENGVALLRLELTGYAVAQHAWGSELHVDEVIARLGVFEVRHLEHELQMGKNSVASRLKAAIERGMAVQVAEKAGVKAAQYRWAGKVSHPR